MQLAKSKYECESAAKALGLSDITAYDSPSSNFPPGCIYRVTFGNWLMWNNIASSSVHCGSDLGAPGVYDCLCTSG